MVHAARLPAPSTITIGIAEMAVSDGPTTIITHALGSCVALVLWDPVQRVGGMIHCLLPSSSGARPGERPPEAFADTGVPRLFEAMLRRGCRKESLEISAVGGASMGPKPATDVFDIGARNVAMVRKLLFKNGVLLKSEDVGGSISRTVALDVATGVVTVRSPGSSRALNAPAEPPPPPAPARTSGPRLLTVPAGELLVADDPDITLTSTALGSSIAVALWDPIVRVGGLAIHRLPTARGSNATEQRDTAFTDTGVPRLFAAMYEKGCRKESIEVTVAGGASMSGRAADDVFDVGARNVMTVRKLFFKNGVLIKAEDVGGSISRTVTIEVGSGRVAVRSPSGERIL